MKNEVVVLVADKNYKEHAKSLFVNIKKEGQWDGDYCLLTNMVEEEYREFVDKGIYVKQINMSNPFYVKFSVFDSFFKQWKKVMYLDCDILINESLSKIQNLDEVDMYCDGEKNTVRDLFSMWYCGGLSDQINGKHFNTNMDTESLGDLDENFDVQKYCFNSAFMYFNTKLIDESTVDELEKLRERFKKINYHVGLTEGTDQPILNLLFLDRWVQIPNKYVSYFGDQDSNTIVSHYCHWSAPWKGSVANTYNRYIDNLNNFNDTIFKND
jgi:lipopolysaccharide biosynthesis glycosyltransferase